MESVLFNPWIDFSVALWIPFRRCWRDWGPAVHNSEETSHISLYCPPLLPNSLSLVLHTSSLGSLLRMNYHMQVFERGSISRRLWKRSWGRSENGEMKMRYFQTKEMDPLNHCHLTYLDLFYNIFAKWSSSHCCNMCCEKNALSSIWFANSSISWHLEQYLIWNKSLIKIVKEIFKWKKLLTSMMTANLPFFAFHAFNDILLKIIIMEVDMKCDCFYLILM